MTDAASPLACWITATLLRSPQTASCSRAAARKVSPAASSTDRFCCCSHLASLPIDVVFPAPFTPASMITNGRAAPITSGCFERPEQVDDARPPAPTGDRRPRRRASSVTSGRPADAPWRRRRRRRRAAPSSSSSSAASSSLRRANTPVSAPASLSRDSPSPDFSRSVHERCDSAGAPRRLLLEQIEQRRHRGGNATRDAAKLEFYRFPSPPLLVLRVAPNAHRVRIIGGRYRGRVIRFPPCRGRAAHAGSRARDACSTGSGRTWPSLRRWTCTRAAAR